MYFFNVISNNETNTNSNTYSRLQCLLSGEVSAVYNTQFTTVPEVGDTLFSMNVKWDKSELGEIVNGLFLKTSQEKAVDAIIDGKAKPFNNSLTKSEKIERAKEQVKKQVIRRAGNGTPISTTDLETQLTALKADRTQTTDGTVIADLTAKIAVLVAQIKAINPLSTVVA